MFGTTDERAPSQRTHQLKGLERVQYEAWMRRPVAELLRAAATSRGLALEPATPCWCRAVLEGARAGLRWCDTPRSDRPSVSVIAPDRPERCEWLLGFQLAACWHPLRLGLLGMRGVRPTSVADEAALLQEVRTTLHVLDAMDHALGLRLGESTVASAVLLAHVATVWRRRCELLDLVDDHAPMLVATTAVVETVRETVPAVLGETWRSVDEQVLDASIDLIARECDDEHLHPTGFGQIFE